MCNPFSCAAHKECSILVHPKGDCHDHTDILIQNNIHDENIDLRWFVRLEVFPVNGDYLSDCLGWDVIVDEVGTLPAWFENNRKTIEKNARKAAAKWQDNFIYYDGTYQNVRYNKKMEVCEVVNYRNGELHGKWEGIGPDGFWCIGNYKNGILINQHRGY